MQSRCVRLSAAKNCQVQKWVRECDVTWVTKSGVLSSMGVEPLCE
jgi:hypothetical protein